MRRRQRGSRGHRPVLFGAAGVLVALAASVGLMWLAPARADAHAELVSTDPAAGEELDAAPERMVLTFTEGVSVGDNAVEVLTTAGERVEAGKPGHPGGDRTVVAVDLPRLDDGTYVVTWRVLSSDSHPISGAFTFGVGDAPGVVSDADAQAVVDAARAGAGSDRAVGVSYGIGRFAAFAGLVVLVGGALFVVALWPEGASDPRASRILAGGWWVALAATVLSIPLQASYAAGGSLADALDPSIVGDELGERTGRLWLVRVALLMVIAVAGRGWWRRRVARAAARPLPAVAAVGLGLLATFTFAGHATTGDLVPLGVVTDLVHLSAVSVWLGGLALLVGAVLRRTTAPAHDAARADPGDRDTERVVASFSDVAFGAVAVIVASGVVEAWRQLGSWDALVATGYGRLLLAKTGVFALMLAAAATSRSWVRQRADARFARAALSPGPGATAASPPARGRLSALRRSVAAEVALAVAVLAVTAALVNAAPETNAAGDTANASSEPSSTVLHGSETAMEITVDPPAVGTADVEIMITTHEGSPLDPEEVTASLRLPERDLGPLELALQRTEPGRYLATDTQIPFPGTWELEIVARTTDIDQDRIIHEVPVSESPPPTGTN